jgi:hypothetical protein
MRYIIINMTDYSLEKDLYDIIINPDTYGNRFIKYEKLLEYY